ncbi:MAG: FAD-binding oxidoreductase [Bacteroidota bacterium]
MKVDYIIVGQGIAGTVLAWQLRSAGKRVIVVDAVRPHTASRVSAGIINPYTGKRMVKVAGYESLVAEALGCYRQMERKLQVGFVEEISILQFHHTPEARQVFIEREHAADELLHSVPDTIDLDKLFKPVFGIGEIGPCYQVAVPLLLNKARAHFEDSGILMKEQFGWGLCTINDSGVEYKGITAEKVICCEGIAVGSNPYFSKLPFTDNIGEVIIADIPGLPREHIYKHQYFILPWSEGLFWIGATNHWKYDGIRPTALFRREVEAMLDQWLKRPYRVVEHIASSRPTTLDRQPFAGFHPQYPAVGIFNGMGTKGCLLAPWLARCYAETLCAGAPLPKETDINRFRRMLA